MKRTTPKKTICLWYDKDALDAARLYAATFPVSEVTAVHHAPGDYPSGILDSNYQSKLSGVSQLGSQEARKGGKRLKPVGIGLLFMASWLPNAK